VGIDEPPDDMFGKLMSVPDALMWRYFELLTRLDEAEMASLRAGHPMDAKKALALTLTRTYHGAAAAEAARDRFVRILQQRRQPDAVDVVELDPAGLGAREAGGPAPLLLAAGLVTSSSEGRRLIQQGAVDVDGGRVMDVNAVVALGEHLVRVGKRAFKRVVLRGDGR
jgi:tyrosyl-tRNA synthetase